MRRNSGIVGKRIITTTSNTSGVHDLFDAFNKVKDNTYQPTIRITQYGNTTLNTTSNTYVENSRRLIPIFFSGITEQTFIYYKFLNVQNTTANTFGGRLPGDFLGQLSDGDGAGIFNAYANNFGAHFVVIGIDGRNNKPNTQFKFVYSTGDYYDNGGSIIGESDIFTIPKIAFTEKTFSSASIDEGSASSSRPTIKITPDANTFGDYQAAWVFTGMRSGGTANNAEVIYNVRYANSELQSTKNWGSHSNTEMVIGSNLNYYVRGSGSTDSNTTIYAEVEGAGDFLTEGSETFNPGFIIVPYYTVGSNAIISATDLTDDEMFTMPQLTISDTSTNATFTVTSSVTTITEGGSVNIVLTDTSQSNNNANFFYSLDGTNINANDFSMTPGNGYITMTGSTANVTVTTAQDSDTGTENFTVNFRTGSNSGPIVASSNTITLNALSLSNAHVVFAEHRYGSNIGTARLKVVNTSGTELATLRTVSGQVGNFWSLITAPGITGLTPGTQIRFLWHYTSASSFRGDYAIDYVRWYKDGVAQSWPSSTYGNFENSTDRSGWLTNRRSTTNYTTAAAALSVATSLAVSTQNRVWNVDSGTTPSSSTGPSGAYSGTYFAYTEVSSAYGRDFWLFSPVVTI